MKITKKTKLAKIIDEKKASKILEKYEFPCISCPFARMEMESLDLGSVCEMYGIDADSLIKELNEKMNKK
ncbi:MAG: hypothetical protein WC386_00735 [Candidatus Paceibacterota bacterium]|jgi:hypothetical protein